MIPFILLSSDILKDYRIIMLHKLLEKSSVIPGRPKILVRLTSLETSLINQSATFLFYCRSSYETLISRLYTVGYKNKQTRSESRYQ